MTVSNFNNFLPEFPTEFGTKQPWTPQELLQPGTGHSQPYHESELTSSIALSH